MGPWEVRCGRVEGLWPRIRVQRHKGLITDCPQARLLHQLSKSQEECTSLAMQLADGQRASQDLQDRLEQGNDEIRRLQQVWMCGV